MALQVWLPLDGDLENQGLTNIKVTNNGTTIDNNGKIGKCYSFGANKYINLVNYAPIFLTYNTFSLSVWFKCTAQNTSHTGSALISSGNWNAAANLLNLALGNFSSDHYTKLLISGSGNWGNGYSYNFYLNTWYHVVLTSGNGAMRAYVNGQLIGDSYAAFKPGSLEQTWVCIGNGTYNHGFHFYGLMNDVRIYDHCLSIREIKELAKGLVLHYKLNKIIPNLMPNSYSMPYGASNPTTGTWRNAGSSTMTKKRVDLGGGNYCFQNSGIQTANDGSCWGIDSFPLAANTQFTISCEARLTEGTEGYAGFNVYGSTPNGGYDKIDKNYYVTSLNNHWKVCYLVFTTNSNTTRNIYIGATTGSTNATIQIKNIKIEIGDHPTPWAPKETDPEYTILGYNSNIEPDCSGYKRDGIVTGTLTGSADTPRYRTSYYFDGINSAIQVPYNATVFQTNFTINLWFKKTELGSKNYETLFGGPSGFEMDTRNGNSTTLSLYMTGTRGGNAFSSFSFGEWYMVTMVNDGTNELYYINGELKKTIEKKSMPTGNYFIGAWSTSSKQNFKGYISDFRIYCTALSADDIKALYEDAGYVDNQGNFHAYEYSEF